MNNSLVDCSTCAQQIAKTAEACPKCGAKNSWVDPRVEELVKYLKTEELTEAPYMYNQDRQSVWGETELKTKSFQSLRYAVIAFVTGIVIDFLFKPSFLLSEEPLKIVLTIIIVGSIASYSIAVFFFAKWIYHALFTSVQNEILQKTFRVDFSGEVPQWTSNDERFWGNIKDKVFNSPSHGNELGNNDFARVANPSSADVLNNGAFSIRMECAKDVFLRDFQKRTFMDKVWITVGGVLILGGLVIGVAKIVGG